MPWSSVELEIVYHLSHGAWLSEAVEGQIREKFSKLLPGPGGTFAYEIFSELRKNGFVPRKREFAEVVGDHGLTFPLRSLQGGNAVKAVPEAPRSWRLSSITKQQREELLHAAVNHFNWHGADKATRETVTTTVLRILADDFGFVLMPVTNIQFRHDTISGSFEWGDMAYNVHKCC